MVNDKELAESFLGKPFETELTAPDGKKYKFQFEQLKVDDLPEFIDIMDIVMHNKNKFDKSTTERVIPLIRKTMDLSCPSWGDDQKEEFIKLNLFVLRDVVFLANTAMLTSPILNEKSEEELKKFIENERTKTVKPETKGPESEGRKQ